MKTLIKIHLNLQKPVFFVFNSSQSKLTMKYNKMVEEDADSEVKSRSDIESPSIPPLESEEETIPTDDVLDDSKLIEYNLEALKLYSMRTPSSSSYLCSLNL